MFGKSAKVLERVGRFTRATRIRFRSKHFTVCSFGRLRRLRLTCTVAVRGSRKSRCPTIVLPLLSKPRVLLGEGLLCATIAETEGYIAIIKGRRAFTRVVHGRGRRGECDTLSRQVERLDRAAKSGRASNRR